MTDKALHDATEEVVGAIRHAADAITPVAVPGTDASGGCVSSLTEAVMGITAGLHAIAAALTGLPEAVDALAAAIQNHGD